MRKEQWEKDYENFDTQKALQELLEDKQRLAAYRRNAAKNIQTNVNPRELKAKIDKEERLNKNIKQVGNIIEYKNKLYKEQEDLKQKIGELESAQRIADARDKANATLDNKLKEIQDKQEKLKEKLKDTSLSEEERNSLKLDLQALTNEISENNILVARNLAEKEKATETINKYGKTTVEDLKKRANEIGTKISKCHLAGKILMKGGSWDFIKVVSAKKYKSNGIKLTEKAEKEPENSKQQDKKQQTSGSKQQGQGKQSQPQPQPQPPAKVSDFEKKHPKLAKFFNKIKSIFSRKDNDSEKTTTTAATTKNQNQSSNNKPEQKQNAETERDEFIDYLKQVGEKGYKEVDREELHRKVTELTNKQNMEYKAKKAEEQKNAQAKAQARAKAQATLDANKKKAYAERAKKDAEYKAEHDEDSGR